MEKNNYFLIKFLILFWLICVVLCASQKNHKKREVHRIVLKERSPRSHKTRGHHGHTHSRKRGHKNKGKRDSDESNSSSLEDSGSYSIENNSFEEEFRGHKSHKKQSHKKPFSRHRLPPTLDIEETRQHSFREEFSPFQNSDWVPLNSDQLHLSSGHHYSTSKEYRREKDRRNKRKSKKHPHNHTNRNRHFGIDFTTSFPTVAFESSTLYPPIDVISSFNALNQKVLQSKPSTMSKFEQTTNTNLEDKLKNHKTSYDVTESHASELGQFILLPDMPELSSIDTIHAGKFNFGDQKSKNKGISKHRKGT